MTHVKVPIMNTELEFMYTKAMTAENAFFPTIKYRYTLNGSVFDSSFEQPFDMEEEDLVRKIVSDTLNQMLSRVAWLSIETEKHHARYSRYSK